MQFEVLIDQRGDLVIGNDTSVASMAQETRNVFLIVGKNRILHIMRITMPARPPVTASAAADQLIALGRQICAHRKALRISATTAAEAAGMSRVTLHRIEKGEPAVTMGAYLNAMAALGLNLGAVVPAGPTESTQAPDREGWIPARIRLADYPQLKQLAWQVQGAETLTPLEAWDIYERNWRHIDESALALHERQLIDALRLGLGGSGRHV